MLAILAIIPRTHNINDTIPMIKAALALPEPVKRGLASIIFLAFKAFDIAIG